MNLNFPEADFVRQLVGQPLEYVRVVCSQAGFKTRLVVVDGDPKICTRDHRIERINLHVAQGLVTQAYTG